MSHLKLRGKNNAPIKKLLIKSWAGDWKLSLAEQDVQLKPKLTREFWGEDTLLTGWGTMEIQDTKKCKAWIIWNIESELRIYVMLSFYNLIYALLKGLCIEFATVRKVPFQFQCKLFSCSISLLSTNNQNTEKFYNLMRPIEYFNVVNI